MQKFSFGRGKLEFIELCARTFKHDFIESAEISTMILCDRGGFSGVKDFLGNTQLS